jgi:large subunit ribosomal protein L35
MLGSFAKDSAMPKLKPHKGVLKRIKITGTGKVKFHRSNTGHLKSVKTAKRRRHLRQASVAHSTDCIRLEGMLHRRLIGRDTVVAKPAAEKPAADKAAQ